MTTKTVTIGGEGGAVVITKTDDAATMTNAALPPSGTETGMPIVIRDHHRGFDGGSFCAGIFFGLLLYFIAQNWIRWQRHRPVNLDRNDADQNRMAADVAALAKRTATLETIVTDPAQRTAREIDALR